ncbi:MAG: response regulator transcription factor [Bacteroidota bacterium]
MSAFKILLVEDDLSYALEIEMLIDELGHRLLEVAHNPPTALKVVKRELPNLALVDINLSGAFLGVELAEELSLMGIPIIFITAYNDREIYDKAKHLDPFAYLIKPFDKITLQSIIESLSNVIAQTAEKGNLLNSTGRSIHDHFFVKSNSQLFKVFIADIQWIHSEGNYCTIQTRQKKYAIKISLTKIKQQLPEKQFLQIHRGFIIQLSLITNIDISSNEVFIGQKALPLGRKYKKQLLDQLNLL